MGIIMIRCPEARRAIPTGMQIDREAFRSMPVFFGRTYCPHCRLAHEWFAKDAWVCDSGTTDCEPGSDEPFAQMRRDA